MSRAEDAPAVEPTPPASPLLTRPWHLWLALMVVAYALLFRLVWDVAAGREQELLPLEAFSRVAPALALLCLFPFLRCEVLTRHHRATRRRLWFATIGFALLFTQECDWMTAIREPNLVGRAVIALIVFAWWLALFTAVVDVRRDLWAPRRWGRDAWTLLMAMACLAVSQFTDVLADAHTYGFHHLDYPLPDFAPALESALELLFLLGMLQPTLRWLARVDPPVMERLLTRQFWPNVLLATAIGLALGLTQWRHGDAPPLVEAALGWSIAFGALGGYVWTARRNGLL